MLNQTFKQEQNRTKNPKKLTSKYGDFIPLLTTQTLPHPITTVLARSNLSPLQRIVRMQVNHHYFNAAEAVLPPHPQIRFTGSYCSLKYDILDDPNLRFFFFLFSRFILFSSIIVTYSGKAP